MGINSSGVENYKPECTGITGLTLPDIWWFSGIIYTVYIQEK
jgi:hypothetical protein